MSFARTRSQTDPTPVVTPVIQKACACGESAGVAGQCPACAAEERLGRGSGLSVGGPSIGPANDRYEEEADRVADRIVSGSNPAGALAGGAPAIQRMESGEEEEEEIQRKAGHEAAPLSIQRMDSEEDEEEEIQRKSATDGVPDLQRMAEEEEEDIQMKPAPGGTGPAPAANAAAAVAQGGRPLSAGERGFFEPRFGRDLSTVRLHTDAAAAGAARSINARAYTLRNHIAFAPGQYAPDSQDGRRLLAHELTHTLQQGGGRTIRRTCPADPAKIPAGGTEEFEKRASEALKHPTYRSTLKRRGRRLARHIIDGARGSDCPMYYIEKLHHMFDTPMASGDEHAAEGRKKTEAATKKEEERLKDPAASASASAQEDIANDPKRKWTERRGRGGKRFRVDRSDPANIVVHVKVRLRPRGKGTKEDVRRTEAIEDAIEIASSTRGYTLDLEFVRRRGRDVFNVGVDPSKWTTSGNWVGDPTTIAHEAHHILGLEDRYNYIESHAGNEDMEFEARLHWFREQMVRSYDPLADKSMMKNHRVADSMNDEDICAVAGGDFETCLAGRFDALPIKDLEKRGEALRTPYRPQHAAMIRMLSDAWSRKPFDERSADCTEGDPLCGLPPIKYFDDSNLTAGDASKYPLANPHDPPSGADLKRTKKPK